MDRRLSPDMGHMAGNTCHVRTSILFFTLLLLTRKSGILWSNEMEGLLGETRPEKAILGFLKGM
jgi:hypothetical protein